METSENLVDWSVLTEDVEYSSTPVAETVQQDEFEIPYSGLGQPDEAFLRVTYSELLP